MEILIQKKWSYTFSKDGNSFFLSVVCGTVGLFEIDIKLTEAEVAEYNERGEAYIEELAGKITYSPHQWISRNIK